MWSNQGPSTYGGDQGGGYLNSPAQFGGSTDDGGEKKPRQQHAQNVVPCTIAQILATENVNDRFVVDNIELHQVTIVGLVRSVNESSTRIEYKIDDMTAHPIDVRQFVDSDENNPDEIRVTPMRENTYIRVYGHVRSFQQKPSVIAFKTRPVTDMNELTTHMLEVVHSHLVLGRGSQGGQTGGQASYGSVGAGAGAANVSMGAGSGFTGGRPDLGLNAVQAQILNIIQACPDEQGININNISSNARGLPQKSIRDAVEFLSTEGHIYSTVDDEHFKSTE